MRSLLPTQATSLEQDNNEAYPLATLLAKAYVAQQELSAPDAYVQTRRKITKRGTSFSFSLVDNEAGHALKKKMEEMHGSSREFRDASDVLVKEEFPLGVFLGPYITDGLVYCLMGPEVCPGTVARCETNGSLAAFEQMHALLKAEFAKK